MIILLNGPPRSGKDTAAEFITLMVGNSKVQHIKMSRPMKAALRLIFGFTMAEVRELEANKDQGNGPEFADLSYREMQIKLFEHLKETYGPEVLGRIFIRHDRHTMKRHTVVSDAGLSVEIEPIVEAYPYKEIGLIQIRRPGCNFDDDIREYIGPHRGIGNFEVVENKYDLELFQAQIRRVLVKWELLDDERNN
jgi:hypothetical protein